MHAVMRVWNACVVCLVVIRAVEEVGGIADGSAAPAAGSRAASTTLNAASVASSDALHATQRLHISSNAGVRVEPQDEAAEDVYGARSPTAKTPSPTQPHCTELGHSTLETSDMRSALTGSMDALMMSLLLLITTAAVAPAGASWAPNVPACAAAGLAYTLWAAARDYVRFKTEYAIFYRERAREAWELENYPAGERGEMIELYMKCGVARDDAHAAVASLAKYSDFFVSLMMVQELGMRAVRLFPTAVCWVLMQRCVGEYGEAGEGETHAMLCAVHRAHSHVRCPRVALLPPCSRTPSP
ncbi:hypothetical protein EON68_01800 [archaeon]|nr:MAG: hypothetical protein EON68_01800 [archaeon]